MKTFLKIAGFLLCLVMMAGALVACNTEPTGGDATTENPGTNVDPGTEEDDVGTEGLEFCELSDGTYGVMGGKARSQSHIQIPSRHNGKAVTQILPYAFESAYKVRSIVIPDSVTVIDEKAFSF